MDGEEDDDRMVDRVTGPKDEVSSTDPESSTTPDPEGRSSPFKIGIFRSG